MSGKVLLTICVIILVILLVVFFVTKRSLDSLARRYITAFLSRAVCKENPPSPFCLNPDLPLDIPDVDLRTFQKSVAFYILSAAAVLQDYAAKAVPLVLPGVLVFEVLGVHEHPALCVTFLIKKTRWVIFRGTMDKADELEIDMGLEKHVKGGLRSFPISEGVPNIFSFPQTSIHIFTDTNIKVHSGFLMAYQKVRERLMQIIAADSVCSDIIIGGHSMGASISQLCALDVALHHTQRISMYAFASTRVGNVAFADLLSEKIGTASFNIKNTEDVVPDLILPVLPDFDSQNPKDLIFYCTSGKIVSITVHATSIKLGHSPAAYQRGIQLLSDAEEEDLLPCALGKLPLPHLPTCSPGAEDTLQKIS
jgi:hypothetical protein